MNVSEALRTSGKPVRKIRSPLKRRSRSREFNSNLIAALDLGTNNCRLLIARPEPGGFKVVDGFSKVVRLGEGVSNSGKLSDMAMGRTLEALQICAERIMRRGVNHGRYVATEACRVAENGEQFLLKIEKEVGIRLEKISTREEAELTLVGCIPLLDPKFSYALTFDVGGGSTEVSWVRLHSKTGPEIIDWVSLPYGVITMTERYGGPEISVTNYELLVDEIIELLRPFDKKNMISNAIEQGDVQMLGTAGTVTTISGIQMGLKRYNRALVDGSWLSFEAVYDVCNMLVNSSFAERASYSCVGKNRAELVVAGCGILQGICKTWSAGRLRVADRGVREGILSQLSNLILELRSKPKKSNGLNFRGRIKPKNLKLRI